MDMIHMMLRNEYQESKYQADDEVDMDGMILTTNGVDYTVDNVVEAVELDEAVVEVEVVALDLDL